MKLLEIRNLRKSFGDLEVIKDISLNVEEGQVVAVIGPSGSGKSTLLRCATMLETMDSGELIYLGEHAVRTGADGKAVYAPARQLRKIQGYYGLVFQNFNLFPHYSVIKNIIDAPISVQKKSKAEALRIGRELLQKMALTDKENAYPYQLSGGQQQRVSIARALALSPKVLFLMNRLLPWTRSSPGDSQGDQGPGCRTDDNGHCNPRDELCQGCGRSYYFHG